MPMETDVPSVSWRQTLWNQDVGAGVGYLWATRTDWINRIANTYEFHTAETVRCTTLIDLTIPEASNPVVLDTEPQRLLTAPDGQAMHVIPLALLPKGVLSLEFELHDESKSMMSRLRSDDCGRIGATILNAIAAGIVGELPTPLEFRLTEAARGETPKNSETEWKSFTAGDWGLSGDKKEELYTDGQFRSWFSRLVESFLLCVTIPGDTGSVHIIKISHDAYMDEKQAMAAKMGWKGWRFAWRVPASDAASYHFEVACPPGCKVFALTFMDTSMIPANEWPPIGSCFVQKGNRHAAVAAKGCTDGREYVVSAEMRNANGGWLCTAAFAGLLIVGLLR